jgi:tRNA threonylcarbamoyladenosine biosynthesis protein TsaB
MAVILHIETATSLCSVALSINGAVKSYRETFEEKSHAANLTGFIEDVLQEAGLKFSDLNAVSVGKGPGSYTGLRIGVSTAKGLCYGAGLPLIATSTLKILALQLLSGSHPEVSEYINKAKVILCPMIDARRMEVFSCLFSARGDEITEVTAQIIENDSFIDLLNENTMIFFGSGMQKCRNLITHPNAVFCEHVVPHASSLAQIAEEKYLQGDFENIAYFEPFYLKDFIATTSKKSLKV